MIVSTSAGFRRLIIPYTWKARSRGISKNNALRLVDQAMNGIFSFTDAPMRLCSFLGFGVAGLALLYALFIFLLALVTQQAAPAGTQTIIIALFFFSGVQLKMKVCVWF